MEELTQKMLDDLAEQLKSQSIPTAQDQPPKYWIQKPPKLWTKIEVNPEYDKAPFSLSFRFIDGSEDRESGMRFRRIEDYIPTSAEESRKRAIPPYLVTWEDGTQSTSW